MKAAPLLTPVGPRSTMRSIFNQRWRAGGSTENIYYWIQAPLSDPSPSRDEWRHHWNLKQNLLSHIHTQGHYAHMHCNVTHDLMPSTGSSYGLRLLCNFSNLYWFILGCEVLAASVCVCEYTVLEALKADQRERYRKELDWSGAVYPLCVYLSPSTYSLSPFSPLGISSSHLLFQLIWHHA